MSQICHADYSARSRLRPRHELTTAMQQLYNTLEDIQLSLDLQLY